MDMEVVSIKEIYELFITQSQLKMTLIEKPLENNVDKRENAGD